MLILRKRQCCFDGGRAQKGTCFRLLKKPAWLSSEQTIRCCDSLKLQLQKNEGNNNNKSKIKKQGLGTMSSLHTGSLRMEGGNEEIPTGIEPRQFTSTGC